MRGSLRVAGCWSLQDSKPDGYRPGDFPMAACSVKRTVFFPERGDPVLYAAATVLERIKQAEDQ